MSPAGHRSNATRPDVVVRTLGWPGRPERGGSSQGKVGSSHQSGRPPDWEVLGVSYVPGELMQQDLGQGRRTRTHIPRVETGVSAFELALDVGTGLCG